MPSRLALVSCRDSFDGSWTIAKGNESKIEIFGLGQAESVRLELETPTGPEILGYFSNGLHVWPDLKVLRYRVGKVSSGSSLPTTVRILLSHQRGGVTNAETVNPSS